MTPRPLLSSSSSRRPLSAIFLGSQPPTEFNIPDLPEPPESPSAASNASGLPSPPATNSTGSGSTGDNNSANAGSTRQRPASYSGAIMPNGNYDKQMFSTKNARSTPDFDEEDENDLGNGEDDTARLDRRLATKSPSENSVALQRVKSLTQRNRMAIDKLSSFSRLSTPSPSNSSSRASRSPLPPQNPPSSSSSSSAASSSRLSAHSHSHSVPLTRQYDGTLSGSETERESQRMASTSRSGSHSNSYGSSSPELSTTPPSSISASRARQRHISAPSSPAKARQPSPGPSRTPRKRVSMASTMSAPLDDSTRYATNDVTSAALAAVASSRRSPTGSGSRRSRQPLPREFRERDRRSLDGRASIEPMTPHRTSHRDSGGYPANRTTSPRSGSFSNNTNANAPNPQTSPRGPRPNRSSTVRELTRRHQTRWLSDDIPTGSVDQPEVGRRQTQRGGSAESHLGAGRSLVGEGLRAAGIGMRSNGGDDVFGQANDPSVSVRRTRSTATGSSTREAVEWQEDERVGVEERNRTSSRISEGVGPPRSHLNSDPPRASPALMDGGRGSGRVASARPATSMAEFYHGEDGSGRGSAFSLRSRRGAYTAVERERPSSGAASNVRPLSVQQLQPPAAPTPPGGSRNGIVARRHTSLTPLGNGSSTQVNAQQQASEHTRLMLESLSMLESNLSRLPGASATVPELFRQAETIVHASDKLNSLLRAGTNRALEEQIDAEVADEEDGVGQDPGEVWRRVGGEYRESLRVSDEVVRSLTGFLLGVGKVLKETAAAAGDGAQQHLRSVSLDDEATRRLTPEVGVERSGSRRSQDGRRSVESRRSWEPSTNSNGADVSRRLSGRADGVLAARPPSSRDRDLDQERALPSRNNTMPLLSATRRLFTPREQREQQMTSHALAAHNTPSDVLDLSVEYEPSPTPASRNTQQRSMPSLAIPPPLPTLPSESLLRRASSTLLDKGNRRKVSIASISTVRAQNAPFPLSTPNPTTAVTAHTVTNSPQTSTFPLLRTDSGESARTSVTFSRPTGESMSALSGLHQQHFRDEARRRVTSSTSSAAEEDELAPSASAPVITSQIRSPLSGSETERDTRRRTIGVRAARASFDGALEDREGDGGGSQSHTITLPSQRRERRRTVTEIFA
ncbi:hypothetical protein BV22DRAFT_1129760 [Leucogyrophana mollusca]|uniref:Uncharacterized protein n=1 Tax=Leucogyrophana mollusca TaxID=85980 RepID=A0ACB8BFJ7_9AGAM|nr:hypothetical protein BV22DRAFT_1129760 [Leucogyrophana mollusca]